jgi:hypothetical protein
MLRNNPKLMAAGAFFAGGVLVGGITLGTAVAHGAGTGAGGKGQSDAQYTAKNAWAQDGDASSTALTIPSGDRLTITAAVSFNGGTTCQINATVNGTSLVYTIVADQDGEATSAFQSTPVDAGLVQCGAPDVALFGYLTPINAG